jgi:hypothetical protein
LPSSMGTAGVAFAERAACCTRAQKDGGSGGVIRMEIYGGAGSVIRMEKGAVLFDGVAISGTKGVRIGGQRCVSGPRRVGGSGGGGVDGGGGGCGSAVHRASAWSGWATGWSRSRAARSPTPPRR